MKLVLIHRDNTSRIVLTPEDDFERQALELLYSGRIRVERGSSQGERYDYPISDGSAVLVVEAEAERG